MNKVVAVVGSLSDMACIGLKISENSDVVPVARGLPGSMLTFLDFR